MGVTSGGRWSRSRGQARELLIEAMELHRCICDSESAMERARQSREIGLSHWHSVSVSSLPAVSVP